jgi:hypothetical protein
MQPMCFELKARCDLTWVGVRHHLHVSSLIIECSCWKLVTWYSYKGKMVHHNIDGVKCYILLSTCMSVQLIHVGNLWACWG